MLLKTGITLLTLVMFNAANLPQDRSLNEHGCALLDENRPAQFIVYEGASESKAHLRLRNNSSCAITVETDDNHPTRVKKMPHGVTIESVRNPQDGLRLQLHYLIQNRRLETVKRGYGWGDSVFIYEIPPGQSIVFDAPVSHLKRRLDIVVPFGYSWEPSKSSLTGTGGIVHLIYLLFEDVPLSR